MNAALAWLMISMPYLVALGLGLAVPLLALALYTRFAAGLGFLALMFAADSVFFGSARINLGVNLYVNDLVFLLLGGVAAARWAFARDMPRRPLPWVLFVALFFLGLGWGLAEHGTPAGVQARDYFYGIVAASYFMSFPVDERRVKQVFEAAFLLSLLLLVVAAYRWTVYYLPVSALLPPGGVWSPDGPTRVIPSQEALLLAQVLLLGLFFSKAATGTRVARWLAPVLLAAVVTLQHRSVWVAAVIGLVAAFALGRSVQGNKFGQLIALLVVVTLTALPLVFSERLSSVTQEVGRSAATAVAGQGTVHSRLQDWRQTLRDWSQAGPRALVVGYGFGRDTARVLVNEQGERRLITFGTHNHYVAMITNTGVLGLAAFAVFAGALVLRLYGMVRRAEGGIAAPALLTLLTMQLAYYVPYGTDYMQHALLGIVGAFVATRQREVAARAPAAVRRPASARRIVAWR
jgi:hypothetical protein